MLFIPESVNTFEEKVQQLNQVRQVRSCVDANIIDGDVEGHPFLDSFLPFTFIVQIGIVATGILIILLILGLIKGLLGLFVYTPIGMAGLGYLVDLPRTLNRYQENELSEMKVVFDTVGWPIHPQTGKRTVRAIKKRMEFCVNVIFFIAFPLVIIICILTSCFTHKTYDEDDGGDCYHKVNTIMLSDTPSLKLLAKGCTTKGAGGKGEAAHDPTCPTKGTSVGTSAGCSKSCKHLPKEASTPSNSKTKSSSSGKSALKSPKSSAKSGGSSKTKSSGSKGSPSKSKSKSGAKSNKSKSSSSKSKPKGDGKKKGGSGKSGKSVKSEKTEKSEKSEKSKSKSPYKDDDSAEDADTQYVLDQMRESESSLENV